MALILARSVLIPLSIKALRSGALLAVAFHFSALRPLSLSLSLSLAPFCSETMRGGTANKAEGALGKKGLLPFIEEKDAP